MLSKEIFKKDGISVTISRKPQSDLLNALSNNKNGTPGGMIYQNIDNVNKARSIKDAFFIVLRKCNLFLGSIVLCERKLKIENTNFFGYYIKFFTIIPPFRKKVIKKRIKQVSSNYATKKRSYIYSLFDNLFSQFENYIDKTDQKEDKRKCVYYGYIEADNARSLLISNRFGYESIAQIKTIVFSRLSPKLDKRFRRIDEAGKEVIRNDLQDFYKDYTFYITQNLFLKNNYYVLMQNDEMVCGAQANLVRWKILEMKRKVNNSIEKSIKLIFF